MTEQLNSTDENIDNVKETIDTLTHEDICEITQSSIKRLIASDPFLSDLPVDVTTEEVLSQIAVIQGQNITITLTRYSETPLNVVVPQQNTTVLDLKKAIRRSFTLRQQRQKNKTKISWKYVWKTFWLQNIENRKILKDDKELISNYEIVNKSQLRFVKRLSEKSRKKRDRSSIETSINTEKYPWLDQITRQEQLTLGCENLNIKNHFNHVNVSQLSHILVDHNHKFLYCYVPKVACTNWKRVMMVLNGETNTTNLVNIPADLAHANSSTLRLSQLSYQEIQKILNEYTLFLIVRHPFERLLSAYRNKFTENLPSSKYFQERYGKQIIKKYRPLANDIDADSANVSFSEFVKFLLNEGVDTNEHWMPIYDLCLPCTLNYTFIGRYETLLEDTRTILNMINATSITFPMTRAANTKDKLREYFEDLSIFTIKHLYQVYRNDFKLFNYDLEELLGYDLA